MREEQIKNKKAREAGNPIEKRAEDWMSRLGMVVMSGAIKLRDGHKRGERGYMDPHITEVFTHTG